jgi:ATP-binding cassette subfamily B protein
MPISVNNLSIFQVLYRFFFFFSNARRSQIGFLFLLVILSSFAEIFSIGLAFPFLAILSDPNSVYQNHFLNKILTWLEISSSKELMLILAFLFGIAALISGALRLLMLWFSTRLAYSIGSDISSDIYKRSLYKPYIAHCMTNSSEILNAIINKTNAVTFVINMTFILITSFFILMSILSALLFLDPLTTSSIFLIFTSIYLIIVYFNRVQIESNSKNLAFYSSQAVKCIQEGLGGIRDVLIDGTQSTFCKIYQNADSKTRSAQGSNSFIGLSPRYLMESLAMFCLALFIFIAIQKNQELTQVLPMLGVLAIAAQRLLPLFQQIYAGWIAIKSNENSLKDVLTLLNQPLKINLNDEINPLPFEKNIKFNQISFSFDPRKKPVLNNINLTIKKGSRVGIIGTTGAGKSTFLDTLMGLLDPVSGNLLIDGQVITSLRKRSWQAHIAHVPQAIFLSDATIEENIAFGIPKELIDFKRVRECAKQAQIADIIESWPLKYQTYVGERGIRLSGGQRQRIGIARALYKNADVIILDEATSALDVKTEENVMRAISKLNPNITLFIVAHRLSSLKCCSKIIELKNAKIKNIGSYNVLLKHTKT